MATIPRKSKDPVPASEWERLIALTFIAGLAAIMFVEHFLLRLGVAGGFFAAVIYLARNMRDAEAGEATQEILDYLKKRRQRGVHRDGGS